MSEIVVEPTVLTHEFAAPMQLVYEAWTQERHLCKWQVPNANVLCEYASADIRPGGAALHKMVMPNGGEMWLLTKYHELKPYSTIVFTQYSANQQGEIVPSSVPNWPQEIRASIELSEQNGVTHMTFTWQPLGVSPEEAEAWEASRSQHGKGWGGSFALLANYLLGLNG